MHTVRRNGTYYFRRKIPQDLAASYGGKNEVTYSLRTKDRAEAERMARRESVALDDKWERMRSAQPKVAKAWPADYDFTEVAGKVVPVPPPRGGWSKPERDSRTLAEVEQAEHEHQLGAAEDEREWSAADAEADKIIAALRLKGFTLHPATPQDATQPKPAQPQPAEPKKRETLEDLIPYWKRERRLAPKTIRACEVAALEFDNLHRDPAVQAITRQMVIAYRDWLLSQSKSVKTINDGRLAYIRLLLGVAKDRGLVTVNHAEGAALPEDKRAPKARLPYSPEQVQTIMRGTEQYKDTHPARYWLPRLARWTGARVNELHQLRRCDLVERDGHRGILITDDGEHDEETGTAMRTKNAGSVRWMPLHPTLAEFWTWATARDDGPLFPAKPNKFGIVSDAFGKWYGRQRQAWAIPDERYVFHSWRHLFADQCRAAGVQPEVRMALMGHAEGGAAGGYGSGELPPKVLAEALGKLTAT